MFRLETSLKPGNTLTIESLNQDWCDKDIVMLHSCFQLLKDCVEKEDLLSEHIDWNATEKHRKAKVELEALYSWRHERLEAEKEVTFSFEDHYKLDDQMLHRLIDIRWALWT